MIDYNLESELTTSLSSGEKLLWTGKPKKGIIFRTSDIFFIPFSILWGGFAIFWEKSAIGGGAPALFGLFGIPFVLAGLYMIFGRFFVDAIKRANTVYGITQDRIIIKSGIIGNSIISLNIKTLQDIVFNQKGDNTGTITFGAFNFPYNMMQGFEWPGVKQPPRLELIEDVKSVYDQIIELQRAK